MKYLYFQPRGGLNDILCRIEKTLSYCQKNNRILLLDGLHSVYKINFSDYFSFPQHEIIYNSKDIKKICIDPGLDVYPDELNGRMPDVLSGKIKLRWARGGTYHYEGVPLSLPKHSVPHNIIVHSGYGGGYGFTIFKTLSFNDNIKTYCADRYSLLSEPYLGIQVRNTDRKCDYQVLYEEHIDLIHSYNQIYVATDDADVVEFFKSKGLNIINFTKYPSRTSSNNLHRSEIKPDRKIKDLICDIYLIMMSHKLLSNSQGGLIRLMRECIRKREIIQKKFE